MLLSFDPCVNLSLSWMMIDECVMECSLFALIAMRTKISLAIRGNECLNHKVA